MTKNVTVLHSQSKPFLPSNKYKTGVPLTSFQKSALAV